MIQLIHRRNINEFLQLLILTLAIGIILVPIFWIIAGAFKEQVDIFQLKFFFQPTLQNLADIFKSPYNIKDKLINSALVSTLTISITIPIATLTSYSFSRFELFAGKFLFLLVLTTQFIPAIIIALPFFILFRDLGLLDTKIALVIVNFALTMPFAIWMLKGFIDSIPIETEESALVDGSNRWQVILNIVLPMAFPGIVTTAIFCFILSWNEFIFALILTSKETLTLPVGLALFQGEEGVLWHLISAAGILIMIPMFIFSLIIQKHLIKGISLGAIK